MNTSPEEKTGSKITLITLLGVNLIPIFGVFLLGWNTFAVIFIYWLENIITGFFNVLRMLIIQPWHIIHWIGKLFMAGFFTFHYGMFTAVHGLFVIILFGKESMPSAGLPTPSIIIEIIVKNQLIFAVLALFLSHGLSFLINFIGKQEYKTLTLKYLMARPYTRVIVLHLVVLAGGFFITLLKAPKIGIILLVILKTIFDLKAHNREYKKIK